MQFKFHAEGSFPNQTYNKFNYYNRMFEVDKELLLKIIGVWFKTEFEKPRHALKKENFPFQMPRNKTRSSV